MKRCKHCLEWKKPGLFYIFKRTVDVMDAGLSIKETRQYSQPTCKNCVSMIKRIARHTMTEQDHILELAILLRKLG